MSRAVVLEDRHQQTDFHAYRVTLSGEDGEHIGPCAEFLSLSWPAKTRDW